MGGGITKVNRMDEDMKKAVRLTFSNEASRLGLSGLGKTLCERKHHVSAGGQSLELCMIEHQDP